MSKSKTTLSSRTILIVEIIVGIFVALLLIGIVTKDKLPKNLNLQSNTEAGFTEAGYFDPTSISELTTYLETKNPLMSTGVQNQNNANLLYVNTATEKDNAIKSIIVKHNTKTKETEILLQKSENNSYQLLALYNNTPIIKKTPEPAELEGACSSPWLDNQATYHILRNNTLEPFAIPAEKIEIEKDLENTCLQDLDNAV